ncbi:hypothetical protein ES708_17677 [subsurface metagenome]
MKFDDLNDIKEKLKEHEYRISKLENLFRKQEIIIPKEISINEFLLTKKTEDDVQRTLLIGYYLEKYENLTSFNVSDLEEGFRKAKEKPPENINYKTIRNIQKGYMKEVMEKKENRKAWILTSSGERCVEDELTR